MSVVFNPDRVALHNMDCSDFMSLFLADNSVDAIVTDPPYGLSFMGKRWDYAVPGVDVWAECLRVLKPGGYLLSFGGTRTYHRLVCNIEDAGFEVRDQIGWAFGSGFPKSHNGEWGGTALKPAWEPICMARKPLIGTVEANWKAHGTGALNIDRCRVGTDGGTAKGSKPEGAGNGIYGAGLHGACEIKQLDAGRWPANLIHDGSDEAVAAFPDAKGQQGDVSHTAPSDKTSNVYGAMKRVGEASQDSDNEGFVGFKMKPGARRLDGGSAARFFYCAKASRKDRNEGCESFIAAKTNDGRAVDADNAYQRGATLRQNTHPTVKPTDLMAYLVRLVTPHGGVVLDPFMGSGSTGKAAMREGLRFIGCELSTEYMAIAEARITHEILRGKAA